MPENFSSRQSHSCAQMLSMQRPTRRQATAFAFARHTGLVLLALAFSAQKLRWHPSFGEVSLQKNNAGSRFLLERAGFAASGLLTRPLPGVLQVWATSADRSCVGSDSLGPAVGVSERRRSRLVIRADAGAWGQGLWAMGHGKVGFGRFRVGRLSS